MSNTAGTWTLDVPPSAPHPTSAESIVVPTEHGGLQGESVLGTDRRQRADEGDYRDGGKYRSVVKIQARFGSKAARTSVWMMGTGWLIRPNLLVTAGHVVYDWSKRLGPAQEIKCYIGYNGRQSVKTASVQSRFGKKIVATGQWLESNKDRTKDLAFIQVNAPFEGNLRLFQFSDTPESTPEAYIGVVGYPGDMSLFDKEQDVDEKGAQMYEHFEYMDFDLNSSARHMLEYRVSTFGGQSGAPVIRRAKETKVIGTHCYGGGDAESNSGNAIGGKYGNVYQTFINLFSMEIPARVGEIKIVNTNTTSSINRSSRDVLPIPAKNSGEEAEGFMDILEVVSRVGSAALPIATSFLGGPIGGALGTVAGSLLSTLSGAESMAFAAGSTSESFNAEDLAPGAAERAVLAEAALQTILSLDKSPETKEILEHIQKNLSENSPSIDAIAAHLAPHLAKCAMDVTVGGMNKTGAMDASSTESSVSVGRQRLRGLESSESISAGPQEGRDFIECLLADTVPLHGEEGFFDGLGSILTKAVAYATPIVSKAAQQAVSTYGPKLVNKLAGSLGAGGTESSLTTATGQLNDKAARLVFKRAMLADASLQALMRLDKAKLNRLKIRPSVAQESQEEGIFDFMKTTVQKLGPIALNTAKKAIVNFGPVLLETAAEKLNSYGRKTALGSGSMSRRPSMFDLLHNSNEASRIQVSNLNFFALGDISSDLQAVLAEREKSWVPLPERRLSLDSNQDLPVIMPSTPP